MMYKHQLFCTLININILICFSLYQKIMLNVHAAKGCNAMYEVYILATCIYHVANAERNCFRGKQCWEQVVFIVNTISKKKIFAIPVEFLYITVHVRLWR